MKKVIQYGTKELDYTNATGSTIAPDQIVPIDSAKTLIAISQDSIAHGSKGVLKRDIIITVPKVASGEIAVGTQFKIGTAGNTVQAVTAGETALVRNAWAHETAADGSTTANIVVE